MNAETVGKQAEVKYDVRGGQFHCWLVIVDECVVESFGTIDAACDYAGRHFDNVSYGC